MTKIAVIGAGTWGTALAKLLAEKGYTISLWVYEEDLAEDIRKTKVNTKYLPDVVLPDGIEASTQMEDVLKGADYVINVVPTQYTRKVFSKAVTYLPDDAVIISASKGIEKGTLLTVSQILEGLSNRNIAVLSGPSFAKEVVKKLPTAVTIASTDNDIGVHLQGIFNTDYFRVYTHDDVLGVELGGALKNVIAIASGISDGLGLGLNARAALIARGLAEMVRLGVVMGAKEKTFGGLSGLGDLILTCTGHLSRNYTVGFKLGRGEKLRDILSGMTTIAEGVATAESAYELSQKYKIEMPVVEQVYRIIYEDKDPAVAVKDLMNRSLKSEFYE
jgi:glycerol-3-phosphate dehydrogenase (NAD(P)+)